MSKNKIVEKLIEESKMRNPAYREERQKEERQKEERQDKLETFLGFFILFGLPAILIFIASLK
jgi:hypothetical protein